MSDPGLGQLDGAVGLAYCDGRFVANVELRDKREQEIIQIPLAGTGGYGRKPGRITGELAVRFIEFASGADEFERWLAAVRSREQRTPDVIFDITLDNRRTLHECRIGGPIGGASGAFWYSLKFRGEIGTSP